MQIQGVIQGALVSFNEMQSVFCNPTPCGHPPTLINAGCLFIHLISKLSTVVYSLDSSIHRINHYPIGQMPSKLTELSTFSYPIRTLFSEKYNPEEREAGETHEIILAFDWELKEI